MKPLSPAPAPVLPLTVAPAASALTAQVKAQKLRANAQGRRGLAPPAEGGFQEQLRTRQGSAAASQRPETAETRAEVKSHATKAKDGREQKADARADAAGADVQGRESSPSDQAIAAETSAEINEPDAQPFVQEVVAQVLQGVDPALRLKPAAMARAAVTVAGNTAAARRAIDVAPPVAFGEAATPTGVPMIDGIDTNHPASTPAVGARETGPRPAPADRESSDQRGDRRDAHSEAKPTASGSSVQADRAAAATSSAAAAFATAAPPSRVVEQRVTLTPTLSMISVAAGVRGVETPKGGAAAAPRSTVAEQVEHGLQVAMQDLPAPAGERLVTLRLHPSALGSLRISMHVSGDAVNVRFQVGSAKAKAAIGKAIDDLKASIAQQGLRVASMEIEEESALAAPDGGVDGEQTPLGGPQAARAASGKGFANPLDAPRGPDGSRADDGTGRTPTNPDAETEGGVLQVLTFRLDAVG